MAEVNKNKQFVPLREQPEAQPNDPLGPLADVVGPTPEIPEEHLETPLLQRKPSEIEAGYRNGELTKDEVQTYHGKTQLAEKGLYGMSEKAVESAYRQGIIESSQVRDYIKRRDFPIDFYIDEFNKMILGAVTSTIDAAAKFPGDVVANLPTDDLVTDEYKEYFGVRDGQEVGGEAVDELKEGFREMLPELSESIDYYTTPTTGAGKVGAGFAQFLIPYGGVRSKVKLGKSAITSPKAAKLVEKAPKLMKWAARGLDDAVAGYMTDAVVWNPREGGMVEALMENEVLQAPVFEYFRADDENPAALERLKIANEGAILGIFADAGITGSAKAVKAGSKVLTSMFKNIKKSIWKQSGGNASLVADEMNKLADEFELETNPLSREDRPLPKGKAFSQEYTPVTEVKKEYTRRNTISVRYKVAGEQGYKSETFESQDMLNAWYKENGDQLDDISKTHHTNESTIRAIFKVEGEDGFRSKLFKDDAEYDEWYRGNVDPEAGPEKIDEGELKTNEVRGSQSGAKDEGNTSTPKEKAKKQTPEEKKAKKDEKKRLQKIYEASEIKGVKQPRVTSIRPEALPQSKAAKTVQKLFRLKHKGESLEGLEDDIIDAIESDGNSINEMMEFFFKENFDEIDAARGSGPITHEETIEAAAKDMSELTGKGVNSVMNALRRFGDDTSKLARQANGFKSFLKSYSMGVDKMMKNLSELSFKEELRAYEHMKLLTEAQTIFYGAKSNIARGLNALKAQSQEYDSVFKLIEDMPQTVYDDLQPTQKEVQRVLSAYKKAKPGSGKLHAARMGTGFAKPLLKAALTLKQANLLWQPITHAMNILGGGSALAMNSSKKAIGSLVHAGFTRNPAVLKELKAYRIGMAYGARHTFALPGNITQTWKNPKEFFPMMKNTWQGHHEQWSDGGKMWKALFTGESQLDPMVKFEGQETNNVLKALNFHVKGAHMPMGTLMTLPFNGLTAGDEILGGMSYYPELYAQAARDLIDSGKTAKEMDEWLKNPEFVLTDDLHKRAREYSREVKFTSELGSFAATGDRALNTTIGLGFKITQIPYYKVIVNLSKYAAKNSPLGAVRLLSRHHLRGLKNGGRETYEAVAGVALGSAISWTAYTLYENKKFIGRVPSDMRNAARNAGIKEYSLRVNDETSIVVDRLDPFAFVMSVTADLALADAYFDKWKEAEEDDPERDELFEKALDALRLSVTSPILQKHMMQGIYDTSKAVMEPERTSAKDWGIKQVDSLIPATSALNRVQYSFDDYKREVDTWTDLLWSKVYKSALRPKRHSVFGTKVPQEEKWPTGMLGETVSTVSDSFVDKELYRLGIDIASPQRRIKTDSLDVKLSLEEYDKYQSIIAQIPLEEELERLLRHPEFVANKYMPDKEAEVKKLVNTARKMALEQFVKGNSEITDKFKFKFRQRARARDGSEEFNNNGIEEFRQLIKRGY